MQVLQIIADVLIIVTCSLYLIGWILERIANKKNGGTHHDEDED